jgi:hypothetical protein
VTGPLKMAAQSEAFSVFDLSKTGILGSNPARGMDMCVSGFFCVVLSCASG